MAVTLGARPNLKKLLRRGIEEEGRAEVAARLDLSLEVLYDYATLRVIPDPETFMLLLRALKVSSETERWMSWWYLQVVAERPKTRSNDARHILQSGLPDPLGADCAEALVKLLNEVRDWACNPSLRELEIRSQFRLKRTTLSDMLNSNRLPELGRYMAFLEACGVRDTQTWAFVWRKIMLKEREAKVGAT